MKNQLKKGALLIIAAVFVLAFSVRAQAATNLSDFPTSYQPYIKALMQAHPNWTFQAYYTNISWDDVMAYETEIGVNMIEYGGGQGDTWYAKDQNVLYDGKTVNLYNLSDGSYYILSDPNWIQPSKMVIAYYLDPRNFLNENDVFMFENMVYNASYQTVANVDAMLKGTWMYQAKLEDDSSMTYAQAFVKIGSEIGISPFLLASRIVQEQGVNGDSPLISGTYAGYTGYYNYFNIEASGQTYDEIYRNGLNEAKNNGWNTRYKALYGGAKIICSRYINRGQTTLYFQKFDVVTGEVSWHQYMGNIQAPYSEGRRVRNTYKSSGVLESAFVFRIPIYNNMPSSACASYDSTAPVISDVCVYDVTEDGYWVSCTVTDNECGVVRVQFPTWTANNGQDDLIENWYISSAASGTINGTRVTYYVAKTDHGREAGIYYTHIYAYDWAGNCATAAASAVDVPDYDTTAPVISDAYAYDITEDGYWVTCTVTDDLSGVARVQFPTWTAANGQDDLVNQWYISSAASGTINGTQVTYYVSKKSHRWESGAYITHIYAYDNSGNCASLAIPTVTLPAYGYALDAGDVDNNGAVEAYDALLVLQSVVNLTTLDEDQVARADISRSGDADVLDALYILQTVAELIVLE